MEYLVSGEIYLKRGPTLIKKRRSNDEGARDYADSFLDVIIRDVDAQTGYKIVIPEELSDDIIDSFNYVISEIESFDDSTKELMSKFLKMYISDCMNFILLGGNPSELNKRRESDRDTYNYSGTSDFWKIFIGDSITMHMCDPSYDIERNYENKDDMQKEFISLYDFLKKAAFVGREFRRTKPATLQSGNVSKDFIDDGFSNDKYIVLYATQELFLVKEIEKSGSERYRLINSIFTLDGNYEFFGKVYEEYHDIDKVYSEIIKQIDEKSNKRRK